MDELGEHSPNIAELQALFRVCDLMRHLREASQTSVPGMTYWAQQYIHPYEGPPRKIERPVYIAGAGYLGSESLSGYGKLRFIFESNGSAVMCDTDGTHGGTWQRSGDDITLRFFNGTVVYHGNLAGRTSSGTAHNATKVWS